MITWMQKHKKWLITTIWVSTIAFVGAGFVGWGSYDYGKSSGAVAVVGDREISLDEYQREYSTLYEQYSNIFGKQFNQELAEQLNLKDQAYNVVIQKNLILSFADEIGLDVTNEEIAKELIAFQAFQKDGKFDKDTYLKVLTQNRTNATDFEESLKRNILLKKIERIFSIKPSENEIKNLDALLFAEDDISIKIIDSKKIKLSYKEEDLKKYWEENKNNYMSEASYALELSNVKIASNDYSEDKLKAFYADNKLDFTKEDGKIKSFDEAKEDIKKALNVKDSKKVALKKYLKLKKGEENFDKKETRYVSEFGFSLENNKKVADAKLGTVIKPFVQGNDYIIVKLLEKIDPKPLSFDIARNSAKIDYERDLEAQLLVQKAQEELKNFKGKNIGYVNRGSVDKIKGLDTAQASEFLNKLFASKNKKDVIIIGDKAVLYKINDSKLATYDETRKESVQATILNLQNNELMNNLVKKLETRYEIQSALAKKDK